MNNMPIASNTNQSEAERISSSTSIEYDTSSRTTSLDEMMFKMPYQTATTNRLMNELYHTQEGSTTNCNVTVSPTLETLQPMQFPKPFSL